MNIFEELDSPRDIAAVVRANKRFRSLGARVLCRHLIWTDPLRFVNVLHHPSPSFSQQNHSLRSVICALTLGISSATSQLDHIEQLSCAKAIIHVSSEITFLQRPTRAHEARILDEIGISTTVDLLVSDGVTEAIYNRASTFTNLHDLTFSPIVLPDSFYQFIHRFPLLDKLVIEDCTAPLRPRFTSLHSRDLSI
ncbi:hypothetical protein OG21DRAFT_1490750 [Imleria badia]|nr:hypothetical protein OG21DRAFT_1490750 [Imleria badia]